MIVLFLAIEDHRIAPARLAGSLHSAGIAVAALCLRDSMLGHSRYPFRLFELPTSRSFRGLAKALEDAVSTSGARWIIPGDEQSVALLQFLRLRRNVAGLSPGSMAVIEASLGNPCFFDACLLKSNTLRLASKLGIKVPRGFTVTSVGEAVARADDLGFPVFLKESFSWAGLGVVSCPDPISVRQAYIVKAKKRTMLPIRDLFRSLLGRHWYPTGTSIDIQSPISGQVVMFCGIAARGHLMGGICATQLECAYPQGPSTAVRICHEPEIAAAAEKMVVALGYSGFISFDFIKPEVGGEPVLIECNARPVPIAHLGARVGVDLGVFLADYLLTGVLPAKQICSQRSLEIILFPASLQPWPGLQGMCRDIPFDDPALIEFHLAMHPDLALAA